MSECVPCPPGTSQPDPGASEGSQCLPCPVGLFSGAGARACKRCEDAVCWLAMGSDSFRTEDSLHVLAQPPEAAAGTRNPLIVLWIGLGIGGGVWIVGLGLLAFCSRVGPAGEAVNAVLLRMARCGSVKLGREENEESGAYTEELPVGRRGFTPQKAAAFMETSVSPHVYLRTRTHLLVRKQTHTHTHTHTHTTQRQRR